MSEEQANEYRKRFAKSIDESFMHDIAKREHSAKFRQKFRELLNSKRLIQNPYYQHSNN